MSDVEVDFGLLHRGGVPITAFAAGQTIFREGDEGHDLFVIKSGKVDILAHDRLLTTLPEGTIFGEMALIDPAPRSATAVAQTPVELAVMNEKQFAYYVSHVPYFALNVMRVLTRRLRDGAM